MNCREAEPLFSALIDDELSPAERAVLGAHLRRCANCRRTLQIYRAFGDGVRAAPPTPVAAVTPRFRRLRGRPGLALGAALALLLILGAAVALGRLAPRHRPAPVAEVGPPATAVARPSPVARSGPTVTAGAGATARP